MTFEERSKRGIALATEVQRVMEVNRRRRSPWYSGRGPETRLKKWEQRLSDLADAVLETETPIAPAPPIQLQVPTQEFRQGRFIAHAEGAD